MKEKKSVKLAIDAALKAKELGGHALEDRANIFLKAADLYRH